MVGSKEMTIDLQQKEWLVRMSDTLYCSLPTELRNIFESSTVSYKNEHRVLMETNKDYRDTYKTYRESKKALDEHKRLLRDRSRNAINRSDTK